MVKCCHYTFSILSQQHEAVIAELRGRQEDMDLFISSGEDLQRELANVPHCGSDSIQRGMDTLRDQWLQVRELG